VTNLNVRQMPMYRTTGSESYYGVVFHEPACDDRLKLILHAAVVKHEHTSLNTLHAAVIRREHTSFMQPL